VSAIAIVNGSRVDPAAPAVSLEDAVVLHGDAYFETLRTYDGRPALLEEHLARLAEAVTAAGFPGPSPLAALREEVGEAIAALAPQEAVIRMLVSRGVRDRGLAQEPSAPTRIVTARALGESPAGADATARTIDAPGYRYPRKSAAFQLQSSALGAARAAGYDEVLIADAGELIEGATSNVLMISGAELITPALGRCLPGVTRAAVLGAAPAQGLTVVERPVATDELRVADEVLITNSLIEIRRILRVDGQEVGGRAPGPVAALRSALLERYAAGALR
jgi:branched-subunit amino acid aminotransferase/4-amino-4-deoxychorismate lyase